MATYAGPHRRRAAVLLLAVAVLLSGGGKQSKPGCGPGGGTKPSHPVNHWR